MMVFVTGGTGYVGRVVISELLAAGHQVTALVRPESTRPLLDSSVHVVSGDLLDESSYSAALIDCRAVVHLVGIIREVPRRGVTMQRIHVDGTRTLLQACANAGLHRFLHMSALGARPDAISGYHRSKWQTEEAVRRSRLEFTIFRPSVIFGSGGPGQSFVGQLSDLVRRSPVIPVIGNGRYVLQPVSVDTVGMAFANALDIPASVGETYELGGPDVVAYNDILQKISMKYGRPFRTLSIPIGLMSGLTRLFQRLPSFPVTTDQLQMLREGNVCADASRAYTDLRLQSVPFSV